MSERIDYNGYSGFASRSADLSVLKDKMGRYRTQSLFLETIKRDQLESGYSPLYTLREHETDGLPSIWQIYMHSDTEFSAAIKIVGSIRHWHKLTDSEWFNEPKPSQVGGLYLPGLKEWRGYKEEADKAMARATLLAKAAAGDTGAAKAILGLDDRKVDGRKKSDTPQLVKDTEEEKVNADFQLLQLVTNERKS